MQTLTHEIAAAAARMVVEDGLDFGAAKRRALKQLGVPPRTALPDNELVESEVRTYLEIFHADTQPAELRALRELALSWMVKLSEFRPHLTGPVWRGTATRLSELTLQLFCDDPKSAEIALLDQRVKFEVRQVQGFTGRSVDSLAVWAPCEALDEVVLVCLSIYDHDELRGALKPGADGRAARGDAAALRARMLQEQGAP